MAEEKAKSTIEVPTDVLASLLAEVKALNLKMEIMEKERTPSVQKDPNEGTSDDSIMKPDHYAELVRRQRLRDEALARERMLGNPQPLGNPQGDVPFLRPRRNIAPLEQVDEAQEREGLGLDDDYFDVPYPNRRAMNGGRGIDRGRGRGRGPPRAYMGRNLGREYEDIDDNYGVQPEQHRGGRDTNLNSVKITIPPFKGTSDPEAFLEWKVQLERVFDTNDMTEEKKATYAISSFESYASTWWESMKRSRRRLGLRMNITWEELKEIMNNKYVTPKYRQEQLKKLYELKQGYKSVDEYFNDFEKIRMALDMETEDEEQAIIRFKSGLSKEIASQLRLHIFHSLQDVCDAAVEAEKWLKEEKAPRYRSTTTTTPSTRTKEWKSPYASGASGSRDVKKPFEKATPKSDHKEVGGTSKTTLNTPSSSSFQCHKCKGYGHFSKECPTRKTMIVMDDGLVYEGESEPEEDDEEESEEVEGEGEEKATEGDDPNMFLVVRRILGTMLSEEREDEQRENLFHARCRVRGQVCSMIIDSGSCANVVSQSLVSQLKLPTLKHPSPYRLQWLSECGELRVVKQVLIRFKIGNYQDEHMFDVVPMQACHLLFGRPWQYDKQVVPMQACHLLFVGVQVLTWMPIYKTWVDVGSLLR